MREIKFRAWDKENKSMYEVYAISFPEKRVIGITRNDGKMRTFSDEYVMQYTGLKDKNNKEIYESDIVTNSPGLPSRLVEFREGMFGFFNIVNEWNVMSMFTGNHYVIGNVYENPELIVSGAKV